MAPLIVSAGARSKLSGWLASASHTYTADTSACLEDGTLGVFVLCEASHAGCTQVTGVSDHVCLSQGSWVAVGVSTLRQIGVYDGTVVQVTSQSTATVDISMQSAHKRVAAIS